MAEPTLGTLNYGHPGAAFYDLDNGQWSFTRQHVARRLKQIRPWKNAASLESTLAVPASTQFPVVIAQAHRTSTQKVFRRLVHERPQLAPSSKIVPELALTSAVIEKTAATYDPLVGNLFSFGSTTARDLHDGPRRIAAMPAGEAGNILRLITTNCVERLSWNSDKGVCVEGTTLRSANYGYWNENAAPIQQVCFAQSEDKNTLLAVRLPTKTVLLRTTYHHRPRASNRSRFFRLPASTIKAQSILSLDMNETGGTPHVHIAFNPDYQYQFGIVDQKCTWSVWDIEHGRKGDVYSMTRLVKGSIFPPDVDEPAGEDGWARILWVGDINTLVVCCRRQMSVVTRKGDTFAYLTCPSPFAKRSLDWILDVQQHPKFKSRFFVLTSTSLILMAVTTSSEALNATVGRAGAYVLASWKHYRGTEDFTLHLCVQRPLDDELKVVLYSRLNHLVQVYSFTDRLSNAAARLMISDPVPLDLVVDSAGNIAQLHIEPMQYGEVMENNLSPGLFQFPMKGDVRFYRIIVVQTDFSIHELVVCAFDRTLQLESTFKSDVPVFTKILSKHRSRNAKEDIEEGDDFIVPDDLEPLEVPTTMTPSQTPRWTQNWSRSSTRSGLDYGLLYDALNRTDDVQGVSVDIATVTNRFKQVLTAVQDATRTPVGTRMDAVGSKLDVPDVDEASSMLQELLQRQTGNAGDDAAVIRHIASARILNLCENEDPTIADIYDKILENWVAPLPRDIPVHIRRRKERLARLIAVEVMLASQRVYHEKLPPTVIASEGGTSQDGGVTLPILTLKPVDSSQSLPTPPHSSIPSSSMPPSSPPMPFIPPAPSDTIARLSRHLRMRDITPTSTVIPPNVHRLLGHWSMGIDPHTYDWSAMEDTLREETLDETSQKQRQKDRKKQERREKRQERENELMKSKAGGQPLAFPQSSQGPTLPGFGSSSQMPSQSYTQVTLPGRGFRGPGNTDILAPMSQVEPGRFGGRPDLKKKKKKKGRVSGF